MPPRWCENTSSGRWPNTKDGASASGRELQVVDQPRLADARGRQHHEMPRVGTRRRERASIAHAEIVGTESGGIERRAPCALEAREVAHTRLQRGDRLQQLAVDSRRRLALFGREILVARA